MRFRFYGKLIAYTCTVGVSIEQQIPDDTNKPEELVEELDISSDDDSNSEDVPDDESDSDTSHDICWQF